jgi:formamidopyrimidine-DNA glycosylase
MRYSPYPPKAGNARLLIRVPELPEVETVRGGLAPILEGKKIMAALLQRPNLRYPFPMHFQDILQGATVVQAARRGKYLLFNLNNAHTWLVHLGMSGSFRFATPLMLQKHDHFIMHLQGGMQIAYNDPRRFGFMDIIAPDGISPHLAQMGAEPLSDAFTAEHLLSMLHRRQLPIKQALLCQEVVAGIGNIYASEALFRARLSPMRAANSLNALEATTLVAAIKEVLQVAIAAGGSSLRDHYQPNGELGCFQHQFQVYQQHGQPCPRCPASIIQKVALGGRATFWCASCQQ